MSNKNWERIGGSILVICGWLLGGIGFAEPIPPPWNTVAFLSMFPLIILGIYLFARKQRI
ncbi:hypothetical protein [Hymenobacter negativus]|uniref:DUF3098 domain-containing protein n=1 Tax=Hymenobacter negativus TaxID=2795026 RepID=A0ABS0QBT7_9BACT|nr:MULTISPECIES: hypothetical protein [Bacteria]MBH8559803.1 hypothetical protein [Hymenobacter negativus]MBH8569688.1 hypothetical protein [Hymenobacter negativus]MBR7209426.1 hypothetical protein [Microvirga sp. STS02]